MRSLVGSATVKRDGRLTTAVDAIVANCGGDSKRLLLAGEAGVTHSLVQYVFGLALEQQRAALETLASGERVQRDKEAESIAVRLPVEAQALREALLRKLGPEQALAVLSGALEGLVATPITRWSTSFTARLMMSRWPSVTGSKVPG